MNKRIISGLAAVVLVLSGVGTNVGNFVGLRTEITASADNLVYGDYTYSVLNDGTVRIMSYNGTDTELVIPDTIDGKSVTAIRNYAFSTNSTRKSLTSVTIPNSVTSIGDYAFSECKNLTSITIGKSVKSIGKCAFWYCSLASVTIPDSVKSVGQSAFKECPKLKSVAIPASVTNIGYEAFGFDQCSNEIPGFRIYCYKGTAGERYAKGYGLVYKLLDDNPYVTSTPGFNCATLKWNAVQGAEKYAVYGLVRGKWQKFSETVDTLYTVKNLKAGTNYEVAVIAMFSGKWNTDFSKAITVFADESAASKYPKVTDIVYNEQYHQFKLDWDAVDGAEKYGVAVFIANKWKIVTQDIPANKTNFTSPKLKAGQSYKMVVCAKVNGKWDTDNISERAVIVKVI